LGGDDDYDDYANARIPKDAYGAIWQTFSVPPAAQVPNPEITLSYRVFSHDRVYDPGNGHYYDDFEVSIDVPPGQITNSQRNAQGCNESGSVPRAISVTSPGLAFCDGNKSGNLPPTDDPDDTGWRTVTLRLDSLSGRAITLYLANWNRQDRYRNTWTYIDNISTNW